MAAWTQKCAQGGSFGDRLDIVLQVLHKPGLGASNQPSSLDVSSFFLLIPTLANKLRATVVQLRQGMVSQEMLGWLWAHLPLSHGCVGEACQ